MLIPRSFAFGVGYMVPLPVLRLICSLRESCLLVPIITSCVLSWLITNLLLVIYCASL